MDMHFYRNEILNLRDSLSPARGDMFMNELARVEKNPVIAYGFNTWLGWLGADRFYVGDIGLGVLKLLTLGGLGLWVLIDYFLIGGKARLRSLEKARAIHRTLKARDANSVS